MLINNKYVAYIGYLLAGILSVLVVLLSLENGRLKALLNPAMPELLKEGDQVDHLVLQVLNGDTVKLALEKLESRTLLFIFSTSCPHCEKVLPQWNSIDDRLSNGDCEIMGISLDGIEKTQEYFQTRAFSFMPYTASIDSTFPKRLRTFVVPMTILLGKRGVVEQVIPGELTGDQVERVITAASHHADL